MIFITLDLKNSQKEREWYNCGIINLTRGFNINTKLK